MKIISKFWIKITQSTENVLKTKYPKYVKINIGACKKIKNLRKYRIYY